MKKFKFLPFALLMLLSSFFMTFISHAQSPFTPGNIVVYRVGDGTTTLTLDGVPVFLDEYTPGGSLVQSIALPTAVNGANRRLIAGGITPTSQGIMTLSTNKQFLVFAGFDAPVGTPVLLATSSLSVPRVIGLADYNGIINTSTALTDLSDGGTPSTAISTNGIDLWAGGNGSGSSRDVHYTTIGSSTSVRLYTTAPHSIRGLSIADGQLFLSESSTFKIAKVGAGLPTTAGQTVTALPGFPTGAITPNQFAFADLDAGIAGVDVLYVADEALGIQKYSLVAGTWTSNGIVGGDADDYRGLTAVVSGSTVTLYATRRGPNTITGGGGELVSLTDASGYNGTFLGTPTVIATTPLDMAAFAGVAPAPTAPAVKASVKAFLQGAYSNAASRHKDVTTTWANILNTNALNQPYNVAPFNYAGTESVSNGFFTSNAGSTSDIIDWVLLELRDATTPATVIARKAALIREDGQIVDTDGSSPVSFANVNDGNYYIVVRHRNHLSVRSANPIALSSTSASYDFTTGQGQAFTNGAISNTPMAAKDLLGTTTSITMLWGGNANSDGLIRASAGANVNDYLTLMSPANLNGNTSTILNNVYRAVDMNLDGTVRASAGSNVNDYLVLMSPGILNGNTSNILTSHQ